MANFLTYKDLFTSICRLIGDDSLSKKEQVKAVINQVYLNELLHADDLYPPHWACVWLNLQSYAPLVITDITAGNPAIVTTSEDHGMVGLELITMWDIVGMTEFNYLYNYALSDNVYLVTPTADDKFSLADPAGNDVDSLLFTPYESGGKVLHHGWQLSDIIEEVHDVAIYNGGDPLQRIGPKQLAKEPNLYWSDSQTTPQYYYPLRLFYQDGVEKTYVLTFPGASTSETMIVYVELAIDPLNDDADVPQLPPNFHHAIISGAVTRLAESSAQVENAVIWPGIYKMEMDSLVNYNRRWWKATEQKNIGKPYGLL